MTKKKIVTSMEKISQELKERIYELYPDGWSNHVKRITKPTGDFFYAITVDTDDSTYLVKVPVKIDSKSDLEKEEEQQSYGDNHSSEDTSSGETEAESSDDKDEDDY
ncbi:MAG: hypothetical protein JXA03_04230 [Bacteroidales bacterium]|nr:hypothetical protein [Bacteroidales bacterium]